MSQIKDKFLTLWRRLRYYLWYVIPFWKSILVILTPIVNCYLLFHYKSSEARCAYVLILMAVYWVTEALPLAITSLIPMFAFPMLGILSTKEVSVQYMQSTNMLFIGGLMVATGIESTNLHRRIALFVILHIGQSPRRLMAGFMLTSMFLSMWISNTAATAMMVPIVDALTDEIFLDDYSEENEKPSRPASVASSEMDLSVAPHKQSQMEIYPDGGNEKNEARDAEQREESMKENEKRNMRNMCFLGVAYSANVGGTGSLTGTGPNLVLKGLLDKTFKEPSGLNFTTWMAFNVPGMIICVIIEWLWLQIYFLGLGASLFIKIPVIGFFFNRLEKNKIETTPEKEKKLTTLVRNKYKQLGRIKINEGAVLFFFVFLVILWLTRDPGFTKGWVDIFKNIFGDEYKKIGDASSAILVACILTALPASLNFWPFVKHSDPQQYKPANTVLTWETIEKKVPWGIVILVGAGYALAEASKSSGLSLFMGKSLRVLDFLPLSALTFVISFAIVFITEITSNTAIASIFLPVLLELSISLKVNPLYLMLTTAVCCSYAFMLPVATPPNAIVFGATDMRISEMMKAGFIMNILCIFVINIMINTLGDAMFDFQEFPSWANSTII